MFSLSMQKMIPLLIALLILCMGSSSAAINANNVRHYQLRQPNKGADKQHTSTIPRSLQLLNLNKKNNKNKTPRPDKTKRPTEPKHPSPTSSPSIDSLSPSIDSLEELPLDNDTNTTTTTDEDAIFSASSADTHNPNDTIIDDGESLTDVYAVHDSSLEEEFNHKPLSGGNEKPIISSSEDMSKDIVEDNSQNTINVGPFDMTFTMYNREVAQSNKKKLLRLLQQTKKNKDTLEQIAIDLYSIATRDHLENMYESTFPDLAIPSLEVHFNDHDMTTVSQGTIHQSKFNVDFYYESKANEDTLPREDELTQMILSAFIDETNKEQFYQRFHDLYANDLNVQQIESVGEIGGTGAGDLLKKLYNVNVQEAGLVAQEDEANTVSEATSEATTPSSSDSSDSGISTGLFIALTVLSCAIIIVAIVGMTVYWKKYHRSSNENSSGTEDPKYWTPLNDNEEGVADDLALVESNDLEQQQEYDMNIMSQMRVEDTPAIGSSEYDAANLRAQQETTQEVSSPYHSSIQDYSQSHQEQFGSNQDISELHEGSVVSGWSMSEVADHDDTTNVDEYNTDDEGGISVSNSSLVGAGELFRTVMQYDTDDDEGQKIVPDMGADKLNTTAETEIVEDYDEDFLGYVVDNDDDDSESRGAFIKEILSRSDEEEDGGEENDFL